MNSPTAEAPASATQQILFQDEVLQEMENLMGLRVRKAELDSSIDDSRNKLVCLLQKYDVKAHDVILQDDSVYTVALNERLTVKKKKK